MCARSDEARIPEQTKYNKMKQGPLSNICGFLESDCNLNSKDMPPFYVKSFSLHKLNHFLMKTPQEIFNIDNILSKILFIEI